MKKMRMRMLAVFAASALLLGGCGTPLYELTDSEESIIVHYAAHVLAKYNVYQKDGIASMTPEDTQSAGDNSSGEDTQTSESGTTDTETPGDSQTTDTGEVAAASVSLTEAIGHSSDLNVTYLGYEMNNSYQEGTYYAVSAPNGHTYLIMKFRMNNSGASDVTVNTLQYGPSFSVDIGDRSISSQITILLNDFSSYEGTIAPGESVDTVLLFELTSDQASQVTGDPAMSVTVDDKTSPVTW